MTEPALRLPPHSIQAEACALGAMMLSPRAFTEVPQIITAEDFYRPAHAEIFRTLLSLAESQEPVDLVSLRDALIRRGKLESVGGMEYIVAVANGVPDTANAVYYAGLVRDASIKRRLIQVGLDMQADGFAAGTEAGECLERFQRAIYEMGTRTRPGKRTECVAHEAAMEVLSEAEARGKGEDSLRGRRYKTGFQRIDAAIHGLRPGHLTTLGAAVSAGKTTLALNIASNVSDQGGAVLYVSAEMPPDELAARLLQFRAGVSGRRLINADLQTEHWKRLNAAEAELRDRKIYLVGRSMSLPEIVLKAREVAGRWSTPINLVAVDYLGIMRLPAAREIRERITLMTSGLKQAAMDLGCCVLLLSQFNRETNTSKRPPTMYSLKESGSIEADSNEVILLHKPEPPAVKMDTDGTNYIEVWAQVAKCRDGTRTAWPCDDGDGIALKWIPSQTLFRP